MLNNVSPNRPDNRGETTRSDRVKPESPPRNDNFGKTYRKEGRPSKEDEEQASVEEKDDDSPPSSVFDLSKKSKTKNQSSLSKKSALQDQSSSDLVTNRQLSSKQGDEQDSGLFDPGEGTATDSGISEKPLEESLFAASDETPVADNLQEMEAPPPQMPGEIKKPIDQAQQMPDQLSRQQGALLQQPKSKKAIVPGPSLETKESGQVSKKDKSKSEPQFQIKEGQEKGDALAVNASIQSVAFQTEKTQETQETTQSATIKDLAAQIVDRIQVMRKEDQTSTIITLRHPPLLEGATITLTTSDHAKREFNIAFANLSPEAKLFLDRMLKEDPLTETLERKGIIVHMLTTSTQAENLLSAESGQASRDRQEQQQQQQQKQQQQNRQKPQEEEEVS